MRNNPNYTFEVAKIGKYDTNLTPLGTIFHDEPQDTVARPIAATEQNKTKQLISMNNKTRHMQITHIVQKIQNQTRSLSNGKRSELLYLQINLIENQLC